MVAVKERWTSRVQFLYLIIHCLDVRTHSTFVAKTPKDDARMIPVTLYERCRPIHMSILEFRVFTHLTIRITIAMSLVVRFVHHIDAITVAEFVEIFAVGIVAGAQEVDIRLLHQTDIQLVSGIIYITTRTRMVVMTVHATQFHILTVNFENLTHNLHLLHTQVIVEVLDDSPLHILQLNAEWVEVGLLGRPQTWVFQREVQSNGSRVTSKKTLHIAHQLSSIHLEDHPQVFCCFLTYLTKRDVGMNRCLTEIAVQVRSYLVVADMCLRSHPQLHRTEDARESPHVLIFQVATVTPAINLHSQFVLASLQILGHVKFSR